jgi:hypothetical protein
VPFDLLSSIFELGILNEFNDLFMDDFVCCDGKNSENQMNVINFALCF